MSKAGKSGQVTGPERRARAACPADLALHSRTLFESANFLLQAFHSVAWQQAGLQTHHGLQRARARYCFLLAALQTPEPRAQVQHFRSGEKRVGRGSKSKQGLPRTRSCPRAGVWPWASNSYGSCGPRAEPRVLTCTSFHFRGSQEGPTLRIVKR